VPGKGATEGRAGDGREPARFLSAGGAAGGALDLPVDLLVLLDDVTMLLGATGKGGTYAPVEGEVGLDEREGTDEVVVLVDEPADIHGRPPCTCTCHRRRSHNCLCCEEAALRLSEMPLVLSMEKQ